MQVRSALSNTACVARNVNHPFDPRPSARFNGWYWDVSLALKADTAAKISLALPTAKAKDMAGLFFENTFPVTTEEVQLGAW